MGSLVMDPEDIVIFARQFNNDISNITTVCMSVRRISSRGLFQHADPFSFSVPVLLVQLGFACGTFLLLTVLLKPLGLPMVVRQLMGGIILGPTLLCKIPDFRNTIFPLRGFMVMDAVASFGYILYFFLLGVQMDPWIFKNLNKKSIGLGFFSVAVPLLLSTGSSFLMSEHLNIDKAIAASLPAVAQAESVLAFPVVAQFLAEIKITNSEFGRVALSSSLVAGVCSFCVITTTILLQQTPGDHYIALQTLSNAVVLLAVIFFVMRPIIVWIIKQSPEGEPLKESYVIWLLLAVFVAAFLSHTLNLHICFGPLALGLIIPAGPPIGSALVDKLEVLSNWIFMPLYLVKTGLIINLTSIKLKNYLAVQSIALISAFGKFLGTFFVSCWSNIPKRDAAALGLVMNAQGVLELGLFRMLKNNLAIDNEAFVIMCVSMMLVTGAITPMIKRLHDPSKRYAVYTKRTVMNLKPNMEFRVLVCIHEHENVPAAINLLEVLNPTKRSHITVFVIHLIELIGRANPLLIPHKLSKGSSKVKNSEQVMNAFRYLEHVHHSLFQVFPFTAICPSKTMHDDVCTIALDKRTSLILVPFHKRFEPTDMVNPHKKAIKLANLNILEKAPCSTAILVDRGPINARRPTTSGNSPYRVAVLFLGGPDDREALAIGARMAGHPNIHLTTIRILENGSISGDDASERRHDNEVVSEFRTAMSGNYRAMYVEEVVMDGTGTTSVIRSMEDSYELVIVGRQHDKKSPLLLGLTDWNYHEELGTIGDALASAPFLSKTTILVVQQHINAVNDRISRINVSDGTKVDEEAEHSQI